MLNKHKIDGLDIMSLMNGLVFFAPVALMVRLRAGVSVSQFFILQAFLSIVILVFEIPTGKITDRIGYRNTIILSQIVLTAARVLLLAAFLSGSLWLFFIEAFVEGIASCFSSGTTGSYLYSFYSDDAYVVKEARVSNFGTAGFIVSTIAYAGMYSLWGLEGLLIGTIVTGSLGVIAALTLPGEKIKSSAENQPAISSAGFKDVFKNPMTLLIIAAFSAVDIVYIMINFFYAEKLQVIGFREETMTIIILAYSAIQLLSAKILNIFRGRYGGLTAGSFVLAGAALIWFGFSGNKITVIAIMLVLPLLVDIPCFVLDKIQNKIVDRYELDEKRAEVLSAMNMGVNLVDVVFLFESAIFSSIGTSMCFMLIGAVIEGIAVIIGVMLLKKAEF